MFTVLAILSLGIVPPTELHVISTAQGHIKGEVHDGYISFKGVPYASVASPDGRFKRAGLAPHWQGIRESHDVHCSLTSEVEECLQLAVHVPRKTGGPWPVLVWIAAAGGPYHPGTLVREGIVLVIVHHRIGPQGFLCLGEDVIPGNAGVKDTIIALRWVRDNIVAFNGDAAKVVLAGQGLGASMAEAIMVSPMSTNLYHGVILQSGSVLAPWAFNYDAKKRAIKLANKAVEGVEGASIGAILAQSKIEELIHESNKLDNTYFSFGMCIENAIKNEERLLFEAPFDSLSRGKINNVPMIIGYNSDEAYIFASILKESRVTNVISRKMSMLLPEELKFLNQREMQQVARQIEDMYFKTNRSLRAVLDYHRDVYFMNHVYRSARLHASAFRPVYLYQFSYLGDVGVLEEPGVRKTGAAHSDELGYLFNGNQLNDDQGAVQKRLVKLWTNFVKNLNPTSTDSTIKWDALDPDHARLLNIDTDTNMMEFPFSRTTLAWDDIYEKYYYTRNRF